MIIKIAGLPPLKGFGAHRRAVKGDVGVLAIMRRSSAKAGPFGNTNSVFLTTESAVGTGSVRKRGEQADAKAASLSGQTEMGGGDGDVVGLGVRTTHCHFDGGGRSTQTWVSGLQSFMEGSRHSFVCAHVVPGLSLLGSKSW